MSTEGTAAARRVLRRRGVKVTLRTYSDSGSTTSQGETEWAAATSEIKAVLQEPGRGDLSRREHGPVVEADLVALVRDADIDAADLQDRSKPRPEIDRPDGQTYQVGHVGLEKSGTRRLYCDLMR